ncbi:hypothetical protein [Deinococcus hohokamensis]|uniref:Uncharacterized protein n=1 Tax=Deinococcus hohokamensis TaxID=309883 RepID=A0ABV9I5S2_9DEIO
MTEDTTGNVAPEGTAPEQRAQVLRRWRPVVLAGLAGAVTVTVLNEGVRRVLPHAPRMEVIGERALAGTLEAVGADPPRGEALYGWTMLADLVSNSLYYGLVAVAGPAQAWPLGGALGLAAGVGAVALPRPLGLGEQPDARSPQTPVLTAAWYLAGGLAAAATYRRLAAQDR